MALTADWMGPPRADSTLSPASSAPHPPPSPPASDVSFSGSALGHIARLESVLAASTHPPALDLDAAGLDVTELQAEEEEEGLSGAVVAVEGGVDEVADLVLPSTEATDLGTGADGGDGDGAGVQHNPPAGGAVLGWGPA